MLNSIVDGFAPEHTAYVAIPAGLEAMAPGPELASLLADIDVTRVSGHDQVVVLQAQQRMVSHHQAQLYRTMAAISDRLDDVESDGEWPVQAAAGAEIRCALRWTRRATESALELAVALQRVLPRVWAALDRGEIDARRAVAIRWGTAHLSAEAADRVVDAVLGRAGGLTTGQLAALIRRLGIDLDPDAAAERLHHALEERRVVIEATDAGTANLLALDLPPQRVAAATRRVNRIARSLHRADEPRTMDQLRADVFLDLLSGAATASGAGADRGVVDLTVDLATLAGLDEASGELNGLGPVIADIARQVARQQAGSEWRFTVTHPGSGMPLLVGTTGRRPTVAQRRLVEARHRSCIFPGCRMPASVCDLDHRITWIDGGATHPGNLAPLCRHDHRIRHRGWVYAALPDGDHRWTSPLGHTYTTSGRPP